MAQKSLKPSPTEESSKRVQPEKIGQRPADIKQHQQGLLDIEVGQQQEHQQHEHEHGNNPQHQHQQQQQHHQQQREQTQQHHPNQHQEQQQQGSVLRVSSLQDFDREKSMHRLCAGCPFVVELLAAKLGPGHMSLLLEYAERGSLMQAIQVCQGGRATWGNV